ncbi:MAG: SDR family oxidoreductase, partial [Desulfosarcinaceae bacterium]
TIMTANSTKPVVVSGAAGNLGSAVASALADKGFKVLAASTDPRKLSAAESLRPVKMRYEDQASVEDALAGAHGLFLIAPPLDPQAPAKLKPVIDTAKKAQVEHIVFTSAFGVDQNEQNPLRIVERYIMDSGMNYTIVRPNFFMENFTSGFIAPMIAQGGIYLPAGEAETSFISTADIAAVAATVFETSLHGKAYNLTGPGALDHASVARIISDFAGKPITYQAISEEEMLRGAVENGLPEPQARYLGMLYAAVRSGWLAEVTGDVRSVTGRDPMDFQTFAARHAADWK